MKMVNLTSISKPTLPILYVQCLNHILLEPYWLLLMKTKLGIKKMKLQKGIYTHNIKRWQYIKDARDIMYPIWLYIICNLNSKSSVRIWDKVSISVIE